MFGYGGLCITGNLEGHCVSLNWIAPFMCKGNFSKARATTEAGFRRKANVKAHEFLGFEAGTTVSPAQSDQSMDACPEKYLSLLCLLNILFLWWTQGRLAWDVEVCNLFANMSQKVLV